MIYISFCVKSLQHFVKIPQRETFIAELDDFDIWAIHLFAAPP